MQVNRLVDTAVGFENKQTGIFHKFLSACCEEEIIFDNLFTELEFLLGTLKVIVDKEALEELSDWVGKAVALLLYHLGGGMCVCERGYGMEK